MTAVGELIVRLAARVVGSVLAAIRSEAEKRARALAELDHWHADGGPAAEWQQPCIQADN